MVEFPRGGLIGRTVHFARRMTALRIGLYAANACYFIVLSVFPALLALLGLLRYTPLEVERLGELLHFFLPDALLEGAEALILLTWDSASGATLGVSAVTTLWSAGRGVYGLMTGLNAVYGVREDRGWLRKRLLSTLYTAVFLIMLILTLAVHVFGRAFSALLEGSAVPLLRFLAWILGAKAVVLLFLQTAIFTAMYLALPNRHSRVRQAVPGALLAAGGWQLFSEGYGIYVAHFAALSNIYGSVYALALAMVWLYCCICILLCGGVLNAWIFHKKDEKCP